MSVTEQPVELTDAQLDAYMDFLGFSAKTVGPKARNKLRPLIRYYMKKKHPFTACVRDNTKRFGRERAERVCATLKDIGEGTTHWRKGRKKASMSEEIAHLEGVLADPEFVEFFEANFTDEVVEELTALADDAADEEWGIPEQANFRTSDMPVASCSACRYFRSSDGYGDVAASSRCSLWHADVGGEDVCDFLRPMSYSFSFEEAAEVFFEADGEMDLQLADEDKDEGWYPVLREGNWAISPMGGKGVRRPFKIVREGESDWERGVISMENVAKNFESQAVQHVTIPTSHDNKTTENTGFIDAVKVAKVKMKDAAGKLRETWALLGKHRFTEPDVEGKVKRGTIANRSGGLLYGYTDTESGKTYPGFVLEHVALTNKPWLRRLLPYGANLSEDDFALLVFAEEGDGVPEEDDTQELHEEEAGKTPGKEGPEEEVNDEMGNTEFSFEDTFGMSEDDVRAALEDRDRMRSETKENRIKSELKELEDQGYSPAFLKFAEQVFEADEDEIAVSFSEGRAKLDLTPSDILRRTVQLLPEGKPVPLSTDPVDERRTTEGGQPDQQVGEEHLTTQEKIFRTRSALYGENAAAKQMDLSEDTVQELKGSIAKKLQLSEQPTGS